MPHLSHLQAEYKDKGVTIIGISDEPLATVEGFLAKPEWAEKTQYTLCTDPDRSAHDAYMKAAMQNGIPTAFIVKDSVVQWIGHPQSMDGPLAQIVAGSWDAAAAKSQFLGTIASKKVTRRIATMMRDAKASGDYTEVLKALEEATEKAPADLANGFRMQSFQILVGPANQQERGYALGKELVSSFVAKKDAMALNGIAWYVVDNATLKNANYEFALAAAKEANSIMQGKDGAILDTLAACHWKTGDKASAIKVQEEAVAVTEKGPMLDEMKKTLEGYMTEAGSGKAG
jgi:tetratricopeptide (TPR) repeat protein